MQFICVKIQHYLLSELTYCGNTHFYKNKENSSQFCHLPVLYFAGAFHTNTGGSTTLPSLVDKDISTWLLLHSMGWSFCFRGNPNNYVILTYLILGNHLSEVIIKFHCNTWAWIFIHLGSIGAWFALAQVLRLKHWCRMAHSTKKTGFKLKVFRKLGILEMHSVDIHVCTIKLIIAIQNTFGGALTQMNYFLTKMMDKMPCFCISTGTTPFEMKLYTNIFPSGLYSMWLTSFT